MASPLLDLINVSNYALQSTSEGDAVYTCLESKIASWTNQRDALAAQMKSLLEGAQFSGLAINEQQTNQLIDSSQTPLGQASACAANLAACAN